MKIPLHEDLVQARIAQRFRTVPNLVEAWRDRVEAGDQRKGKAASLKTVYRWLQEAAMPSKPDAVFGLAAALDIDPVTLFDIRNDAFPELYARERRLFQMGATYHTPLSPFRALYLTSAEWPGNDVANTYYGRLWQHRHFLHDPATASNVYAAFYLEASMKDQSRPVAYHFAYRRTGDPEEPWRPYGTVIGYDGEVLLFSDRADRQWMSDSRSPAMVVAETYFGAGSAEFRVASLHGFTLDVIAPSREDGALRFLA